MDILPFCLVSANPVPCSLFRPIPLIKSADSCEKYFREQLSRLRTDYVDYYLMHMLTDVKTWRGRPQIVLHHLLGIHAGQHAGHLRLVPEPPKRPLGRRMLHWTTT